MILPKEKSKKTYCLITISFLFRKEAEIRRFAEPTFASGFIDGQFDYDDDIDYGYFDFGK